MASFEIHEINSFAQEAGLTGNKHVAKAFG